MIWFSFHIMKGNLAITLTQATIFVSPCRLLCRGSRPVPLKMLLTWYIVSEWIGFITAYNLFQRINKSIIDTWNIEANSFCATTTMQGYQYYAIGCDTDILSVPGTKADNLILRAYLRILIRT